MNKKFDQLNEMNRIGAGRRGLALAACLGAFLGAFLLLGGCEKKDEKKPAPAGTTPPAAGQPAAPTDTKPATPATPASAGPAVNLELAAKGKELYTTKICITCHQVSPTDPPKPLAPSHIGIYGRVTELQDGTKVTVDDAYITESIKTPLAKLAKGYQPIMPPMPVSDDEIKAIIEFLKTLK